jgi:hypothetical protein
VTPQPPALQRVMEEETVRRLVNLLRTPEQPKAAAQLLEFGATAVPALLEALERRDVELRRQAVELLRRLLPNAPAFDPYAPEAQRRRQLAALREQLERKAG